MASSIELLRSRLQSRRNDLRAAGGQLLLECRAAETFNLSACSQRASQASCKGVTEMPEVTTQTLNFKRHSLTWLWKCFWIGTCCLTHIRFAVFCSFVPSPQNAWTASQENISALWTFTDSHHGLYWYLLENERIRVRIFLLSEGKKRIWCTS